MTLTSRLNALLLGLLVLSALALVTSQHRARLAFVAVERAQAHANAHEVRWNQLQVEQTELAQRARIDQRARRELAMQPALTDRTLHLSIDPVTRHVSLSQPFLAAEQEQPGRGSRRAGAAVRPVAEGGATAGVQRVAARASAQAAARSSSPAKSQVPRARPAGAQRNTRNEGATARQSSRASSGRTAAGNASEAR